MADGLRSLYNLIPAHMRLYGEFMGGKGGPITERDFTDKDLEYLAKQVALKNPKKGKITPVAYEDYNGHGGRPTVGLRPSIYNSLGGYNVVVNEDGTKDVIDTYDFNKDENKYFGLMEEGNQWENLMSALGTVDDVGEVAQIPEILARYFRGDHSRPVKIRLPKEQKNGD